MKKGEGGINTDAPGFCYQLTFFQRILSSVIDHQQLDLELSVIDILTY